MPSDRFFHRCAHSAGSVFVLSLLVATTIFFAGPNAPRVYAQGVCPEEDALGNGSFETPSIAEVVGTVLYSAGDTFDGWSVELGEVSHSGIWQAAAGTQVVELNGDQMGIIYRSVPVIKGTPFTLRFAVSGDPQDAVAPAVKMANVWWEGEVIAQISFDTTGRSTTAMGWTYYEYTVKAGGTAPILKFQSTTSGAGGIAIDDITLVPIFCAEEGGLVPCGRQVDDPSTLVDESAPCGICHTFVLANNVLDWVIFAIAPVVALFFLVFGGFTIMFSRGSAGQLTSGKNMVISTLIGLAVISSAWVLVGSFLEAVGVASWTGFGRWWEIECPVPEAPAPLIPGITFTPASPKVPRPVSFQDSSSGPRDSWLWDFGDGSYSTLQNPTHSYKTPGEYLITLRVSGTGGSATAFKTISVDPTFTSGSDFSQGTMINVIVPPGENELQLESTVVTKNFIWVAVSNRGTIVKIDVSGGNVLGEYRTAPQTVTTPNPSRTTVDANGYVWVTNRNVDTQVTKDAIKTGLPASTKNMGSVAFIGLKENNGCVDRNTNGQIDTSTGLQDIKDWDSAQSGADNLGGVSTAQDECILQYVRINSSGARHLSIDAFDTTKVWAGGIGSREWDLIDSKTGAIVRSEPAASGAGGYGGVIDKDGVLWSTTWGKLLRWLTSNAISTATTITPSPQQAYGLCIDKDDNIWATMLDGGVSQGKIAKIQPDGTILGYYAHGNQYAQGCAGDTSGNVWVAHSVYPSNTVGHLLVDGTYIGNVTLDPSATASVSGVAVDSNGKIWATGYGTGKVYRINPAGGAVGLDASTKIGAVDRTVDLEAGANSLYNYSDMTGSTVVAPPTVGTWTVVYDSDSQTTKWNKISWTEDVQSPASLAVNAVSAASISGDCSSVSFGAEISITNGAQINNVTGECLKISITFDRGQSFGPSPVLSDLTVDWDP